MKFLVSFILYILLSFAACLYFPWWSIALVCFVIAAFVPQKPILAFMCALLALMALWSTLAFLISMQNEHVLAHRISVLVLKTDNVLLLITATGLIGGLVGGFAALSGTYFRKMWR